MAIREIITATMFRHYIGVTTKISIEVLREMVHEPMSYGGNPMANPLDMLAATKQARSLLIVVAAADEE